MLSGRLPVDTGVRDNAGFVVKDGERLLAEILRDRGYATGAVVSTFELRKASGISQGFGFFDDKMAPAAPDITTGEVARDGTESERIAEQWLDVAGTSRSFLFLQLNEPHAPYTPPSRFMERLPYDGEVAYADEIIGRLVAYLKAHQLYDRSTILLTADHGEGLGDHGEQGHGLFVYEEALHVPLIVKQAASEGAGRRVADLVEHVDIMPTLLDLAKAPDPGNLRGQTLKPLLDGSAHITGRLAYGESHFGHYHFGWHGLTTVTDGRYRYIDAPKSEFYDLQHDPTEARNIADDHEGAAVIESLRGAVERLKKDPQPAAAVADEDRERFEALGDVGRGASDPAVGEAPDPKGMYHVLVSYRAAVELAMSRQWPKAIAELQTIVRQDPSLSDVWRAIATYAFAAGRNEQAADAYKHVLSVEPHNIAAHLGATAALIRLRRLDEAREHARLADTLAPDSDVLSHSSAHEWLARIALIKRDAPGAREEAALAKEADPTLPLPLFVDGRLLYDQAHYADALPLFEQAVAEQKAAHGRPIVDLHYYLADTLIRVQRAQDAETELLAELKAFPENTRARAALATLEHNAGRGDDVEAVMDDLVRISPTADVYTLSARLWSSFGERKRAADARAEALRLSAAH